MRRDIKSLLLKNQEDILKLLHEKELITDKDLTSFTRAALSAKGKALVNDRVSAPDEFIHSFRALFPKGAKNNKTEINEKINVFLRNNPDVEVDWDKFLRAAELYVSDKGSFCGYAKYFFHKTFSGEDEYRILEYLEYADTKPKSTFGTKIL